MCELSTQHFCYLIFKTCFSVVVLCNFYLFGVLRRFQHCTGHITTGSWKGRGNQYIEFARVVYCKLPTNGKQLPAFPLKAVTGIEPRPQRWEARVLPLCHCGPWCSVSTIMLFYFSFPSFLFRFYRFLVFLLPVFAIFLILFCNLAHVITWCGCRFPFGNSHFPGVYSLYFHF